MSLSRPTIVIFFGKTDGVDALRVLGGLIVNGAS